MVRHRGREDIYIRVGSTSRLATREQQARLFEAGGLIQTESLPVSGSGLDDLSRERLTDYLARVVGERELPETAEAWHERLCALGLMVERDNGPPACTVAGLVLFGYRPRRLIRHAGVRWMCFAGRDKNGMTVEKMLAGQRTPRNLLVSEVLRDYAYADARGMGIRNKIVPLMREHNRVSPEFEATEDHLRLTLRRRPLG